MIMNDIADDLERYLKVIAATVNHTRTTNWKVYIYIYLYRLKTIHNAILTSRILTCTVLKGHCLFVLVFGYVC